MAGFGFKGEAVVKTYWFSCPKFTVMVATDSRNRITDGAPFIRKFIGQHRDNLRRWAAKFGPVAIKRID